MSRILRGYVCALGAVAGVSLGSCRSGNLLSPDFSGAVVTVVDSGPALESARTFVLPDTIVDVSRTQQPITHAADAEITATIRQRLLAFGWRDVAADSAPRPDVIVLVGAATRIQTGVVYSDWFASWGYLPYWGPAVDASWVWGAPVAYEYAFPAGTLLITMLDLRHERVDTKTIPLLWTAAIDGVLTTAANTLARATFGIDQAFAQSNYLRIE